MSRFERYGIYFIPQDTDPLLRLADAWLGRDTLTGVPKGRPDIPGLSSAGIAALTKQASTYGFHGTLKAPFRLASGATERRLFRAVATLAEDLKPAPPMKMRLDELSGFLAIRPLRDDTAVRAIGNACVTRLDDLRAPMSGMERRTRLKAGLSDQQIQFLLRWGYPYVLSQFRFHLTLTGALRTGEADQADQAYHALKNYFAAALAAPLIVDHISICGDPGDGRPFEFLQRCPLRQAVATRRLAG